MFNFANLPIVNNGRIYHLDLLPEELADTIITVGDPMRVASVSQHFDSIDCKRSHREFTTHTGYIGGRRFSVLSTGIGTPNIDIVINEIEALKNIDFKTRRPVKERTSVDIIRFGTTGALQKEIETGVLIMTDAAIGLDGLLHYYDFDATKKEQQLLDALESHTSLWPIKPYVFEASSELNQRFQSLGHHGITVTCPGFYGPQDRELTAPLAVDALTSICRSFDFEGQKMVNLEMETAAILGLSRIFGFRATSIATALANRESGAFSGDTEGDVCNMIEAGLEALCS